MCVRRDSGGKTLGRSADAAIGPPSFGSNNCLGCAARAGAALQNQRALSVPPREFWQAQKQLQTSTTKQQNRTFVFELGANHPPLLLATIQVMEYSRLYG